MGWWILDEIPESADAFFSDMFTGEGLTVLASAIVEGSERHTALDGLIDVTIGDFVWYAAVRDSATGEASCFLALFSVERAFAFKEMHDTEAPALAHCPASILDMLTPLPDCQHEEWYCRYCNADIVTVDGLWMSVDVPGTETAGAYCSSVTGDGPRLHEPGGTGECEVCRASSGAAAAAKTSLAEERCRFSHHDSEGAVTAPVASVSSSSPGWSSSEDWTTGLTLEGVSLAVQLYGARLTTPDTPETVHLVGRSQRDRSGVSRSASARRGDGVQKRKAN